ncbi:threonine/serine exporter family protein [uncultured Allofournierella sp.]|uniref:threonine/serine exporter family protein n=1 Tax=uncultured Allofournierella sp. TaxID=1940258 RepID=UPI003751D72C
MMLMHLLEQLVPAFVGTVCFGLLFHVPHRHLAWCGAAGTVGWLAYWMMMQAQPSAVLASLVAVIPLTLLTRVLSVLRRAPVTLFLIPGIFPLVPGAGIYYTAYAFITGDTAQFAAKGTETLKIAVALAMGIAVVVSVPLQRREHILLQAPGSQAPNQCTEQSSTEH